MSIPLYVSNSKAYIWDPQHAATLRVTHHICGLATGTLPGVAQQNLFLGLPLVLMPEEVVLLLENEICHLVYTPRAIRPPTPHEIAQHTADRLTSIHEMQVAAVAAAEEKKRAFQSKREGGKGKREERRKEGKEEAGLFVPPPPTTTATATPTSSQAYFSSVPSHLTTSTHPWFRPTEGESLFHSLPSAREAGVWTYPSTPLERARCATFRKVWTEGMFMGQGVKFGGEFLVYPGDPLRYHSHFVTTTLPTPTTPIRPLELVAWGRLGTATKKAHLLCCVDLATEGGEDKVECYSLEWANFG
ncbi:hypothetical protein QFC20_007726 [Naganishia adeliensis]|uniref:Uncharacterized protein n=1 Tax=Naganishia adeliensis TaxID=92952 RepID=A0ACC2UVM7_9TREE|nr:hypothetical protein QFC20_007726 [Naganishia adeliensis]